LKNFEGVEERWEVQEEPPIVYYRLSSNMSKTILGANCPIFGSLYAVSLSGDGTLYVHWQEWTFDFACFLFRVYAAI